MTVWTLGINHQSAPLDVRARFAFAADQLQAPLATLRTVLSGAAAERKLASEATILSTCNRTEVYGTGDPARAELALSWLAQQGGVSVAELLQYAYTFHGPHASRHAFRVASGLDSMVLGESQILGQFKDAMRAAQAAGTLGSTLHQLFQRSFSVAKAVRSQTAIGTQSISMAAACVRLSEQVFEDVGQIRVLLVGAGEMIDLVATHFADKPHRALCIANRSAERGLALAQRFNADCMPLVDLPKRLHEFDAVVSCTASTLPIIGLGAVEQALKLRKHKPILMVDLAVPRDIEAQVADLADVFLYTVDDLAQVVQTAQASRQAAVLEAERIIDAGVLDLAAWLAQRQTVPLIQRLQQQSQDWQSQELQRAQKMLGKGEPVEAVLQALAHGLSQKMLHGPMQALHSQDPAERTRAQEAIADWFLQGERKARLPHAPSA